MRSKPHPHPPTSFGFSDGGFPLQYRQFDFPEVSIVVNVPRFSWRFLLPQYWLLWLGAGILYLISWLPYRMLMVFGA
ncbi:LpxL/LpxP family acyltransferase, partial [Rheinheimera soli]|uniref:LpxL/LpxP family acyltransferase n=1 Tax=Rheinheimera soli TaxID=443616 RepID=UPI003F5039AF